MAIGQALLTKPPKLKAQQQRRENEIQKVNNAAIFQEQTLKFEQSLQLVQTLLGASIGCLSFLRGLLPEECFVEKRYGGKSSAAISYRSFTSDIDDESFKKTTTSAGTRVKRLRRGYSGEADQLLDWLEIGIFDALQKGYLKAIQLAIYVDKEHPEIIVESYTFSFSYREKGDGTSTISLRVTDITGRGVTVEDANKNLQLMMRRLIVITQNLPPLPDQRWLTIRLHYLDHTPSDYDPPSFIRVSANSSPLKFHESETKEIERLEVGGLDAGFHAVSLKISSMNDTEGQERPRRRRGSRFIHADTDIEVPQFTTDPPQTTSKTHNDGKNELLNRPIKENNKLKDSPTILDKPQMIGNHTYTQNPPTPNLRIPEGAGRNTQEKMSLRGMLRSATRENDIIETQPLTAPQVGDDNSTVLNSGPPLTPLQGSHTSQIPITTLSDPASSPPRPTRAQSNLVLQQASTSHKNRTSLGTVPITYTPQRQSPRKGNAGNQDAVALTLENPLTQIQNSIESVDKTMAKLKLSKAKTIELKRNKNKDTPRKSKTIERGAGGAKEYGGHINCECGDEKFEEDMICCDNCDEWQHTDCYGFASAKDNRIPDYHVCYSCLLGVNEGKLLEEMRNMALFRRALKTIWNQSSFPSSNKAFANKLGCDLPTALQITRDLESEGFIVNDTAKAKIRKKKVYEVVKTNETRNHMNTEYFDPLKKISHHFENPTSPNIIRESLLEETLLTKPPPELFLTSLMDTIVQDSQKVGNTTKEATVIFDKKNHTRITDTDMESTADEEEDTPPQKPTWNNMARHEATIDRLRDSNHLNTTNPRYDSFTRKRKNPAEISESPEPMEVDSIEEPQISTEVNMIAQAAAASHHRKPLTNVGGVLEDIFVGEELGHRRL